jgi:hypothetical protein
MNNLLESCFYTNSLINSGFSFDEENINIVNYEKKYPKNELTSSSSILISAEDEIKIYKALDDIKNNRVIELNENDDIIDELCK